MSLGLDESKGKEAESEREVDASYRTLRIIWLAILASVIALFVVTRVIQPSNLIESKMLFWGLWACGFVTFAYSFVMRYSLLNQAAKKQKPELVRSAYIIAFAMCEASGIFGLITHVLTGERLYYLFFILSGFGVLMHKPQRDDLLAAYSGGGAWEARKND